MQSRYYDPETGRFINADNQLASEELLGNNLFAYCGNSPVIFCDPSGHARRALDLTIGAGILPTEPEPEPNPEPPYIKDQKVSGIGDLSLGLATIGHGGCGVVAAYNALISMGVDCSFEEVLAFFNKNPHLLNAVGIAGMMPHAVITYFLDKGYDVSVTATPAAMDMQSAQADACILWYVYQGDGIGIGGHFVAYHPSNNEYLAYNIAGGVDTFSEHVKFVQSHDRLYTLGIYIYK